ncbi:RNA polymerase sigma factor [Sphingomonas oryzagri]
MSETGPRITEDDADSDSRDLGHIYRDEAPWLVRFFRRQLGNTEDAQDMTQETMLRYMRAPPTTRITTPQAYLRRIATNLLRNRFEHSSTKLAQHSVPLLEGLDIHTDFDQHRELASREELAEWEAILKQLSPRTLEVFLLSRVDGFTYKEIAGRLGITTFGVNKHMVKAIAHIDRSRRGK